MDKTRSDSIDASAESADIFEESVAIPWEDGAMEGELTYDPMADACDAVLLLSPHPNFAGTMDNNVITTLARQLGRRGFTVLRFNYPGVGKSAITLVDGESSFDFWEDVEKHQRFEKAAEPSRRALRFLKSSMEAHVGNIHLVGYSFGGVIAMILATDFPEIKSATAIAMPWISRYYYGFLKNVRAPQFFITGVRDFAYEKDVFHREWPEIREPKKLYSVENDHFFRKSEEQLARKVINIVENLTKAQETEKRKKKLLIPCVYHFYRDPPVFVRGEGVHLYDDDGKKYLDMFSGVSVNHLGHCHPAATKAIREQACALCHTTTIYLTEPMLDLAEKMVAIAPVKSGKVFFCASGSEANETAVFLARRHTGKNGLAALENSLHGGTALTLSLTGIDFWKKDFTPDKSVIHAPAAYCYRCPFEKEEKNCDLECALALENAITQSRETPAALFIEIIQANGGIVVPPAKWFERLKEIIARHGILLVADEVQTALGRTGRMFACEHFDLEPHVVTVAKSFGGGLPLAAAIATDDVSKSFTNPRASTFGGNLVAAKAGQAVVDTVVKQNLVEKARTNGEFFKSSLLELKGKHPVIGEVRGLGLMIGVELVGENKVPAPKITDDIMEMMKDDGFIVGKSGQGRNVLAFMPPLIVSRGDIERTITALDRTLEKRGR